MKMLKALELKESIMESIDLNGQKVALNIIHHDSGEEPESSCVNRMLSVKLGEKTYHQLATSPIEVSKLVHHVAADALLRNEPLPHHLTVIVTSFAKAFDIEWPATPGVGTGN